MSQAANLGYQRFMRLAINLAKKGFGKTNPNPLVGAVVVKNNRVVGQGYHRRAGLAHAEVVALDQAGGRAKGASLYVTLEPCCHFGRTPACVDKIVASKIGEVIFAMYDPNPLNNGRGARFLRAQGIKVVSGIMEDQARAINRVFTKYISKRLPFVTVKVAQSLDGKIATKTGHSRWISSLQTRRFAHRLRAEVDAIMVGINTILLDDPLLSCRMNRRLCRKQPKKVILDSRLKLPSRARIFSSRSPAEVLIATTKFAPRKRVLYWQRKGFRVLVVKDRDGRVNLKRLLKRLAEMQISHILLEGGAEVIASALEQRLVDRLFVAVSPKIVGGRSAPTAVGGSGINRMEQARALTDVKVRRLGPDLLFEGRVGPSKTKQGG